MNDNKIIAHYHLVNNLSNELYNKQHETNLDLTNPLDVAKAVIDLGYRKERDTAREICDLILEHWEKKKFVECDWLRVAIAEKYGVDLGE